MPEMGRYCKAYLASSVRAYPGWTEKLHNLRQPEADASRGEKPEKRTVLKDDDIVYLHENYLVTDDCYKDEYVIFDDVTDDWRQFCVERLGFTVPDDVLEMSAGYTGEGAKATPAASGS